MHNQEVIPLVSEETELNKDLVITSEAGSVPEVETSLDAQIAEILGEVSLDFLEKTLAKQLGESYQESKLSLLEKINLILVFAARKKVVLPPHFQQTVKNVHVILPDGQLDISYLRRLQGEKRKYYIQVLSSLILLLCVGFGIGKSLSERFQNSENKNKIEQSSNKEESNEKATEARAEFDKLYNSDLATVVDEMGWKVFLMEYSIAHDEKQWPAKEVFQLIRTQEPRYWGQYVAPYPELFLSFVAEAQITPEEFMSSCDQEEFFYIVSRYANTEFSWLNLWSIEELFEALKVTTPNWGRIVADHQDLFVTALDKEDLREMIVQLTAKKANLHDLTSFLEDYEPGWEQTWSRRELLSAIKAGEMPWEIIVRQQFAFFKRDITHEDLEAIVKHSAEENFGSAPGPNGAQMFSGYYEYKLYRQIEPNEYAELIEKHFGATAAENIFTVYPELNALEKSTIPDLFQTKSIHYVLDNYDQWKTIFPMTDIMSYVREENNSYYYSLLVSHPQAFQNVTLTDEEIFALAFSDNGSLSYDDEADFFRNFNDEWGWQSKISVAELMRIGRSQSGNRMYYAVIEHPELFLPYFTDEDLRRLIAADSGSLAKMDVLHTTDPVWQPFITVERRRNLLESIKSSNTDWASFIGSNEYFFADILTFEDAKIILDRNYFSSVRDSELWKSNVTPEWEYNFFKQSDPEAFVYVVFHDPERYRDLLTDADKKIILESNLVDVLLNYHFWYQTMPPEFILDYYTSGESEKEYGAIILANKPIFGYLFYEGKYNFNDLITHGGYSGLFNTNSLTQQSYYQEWSEFATLEEVFAVLKTFDEGKRKILSEPEIFFEFVEFSDLELFLQMDYGTATLMGKYEDWKELWSFRDIYETAKRIQAKGAAEGFFDEKYATDFINLTQPEDLSFLIASYSDDNFFQFDNATEILSQKWTAEEILTAIKEEHPETWGAFVSEDSLFFQDLLVKEDLEVLVATGARPDSLMELGFWNASELLPVYKKYQPEKWGDMVLSNQSIFEEEVVKGQISLLEILQASSKEDLENFLYSWKGIWSEAEIKEAYEIIGYSPDGTKG